MPDLAEGQVAVVFLLVCGAVARIWGEGELEVGAQNVDARLAQVVVGGVVGKTSQGMDATQPDGRGVRAKFVDGLGEALGVQPGGFPVGASFVDALPAVGDDQGDKGTGPGDHSEGEFYQVEERLGVDAAFGLQLAGAEQAPAGVEHGGGDSKCGEEGQGEDEADVPQTQFPIIGGWSRPPVECHADGDTAARSTVAAVRGTVSAPVLKEQQEASQSAGEPRLVLEHRLPQGVPPEQGRLLRRSSRCRRRTSRPRSS